MHKQFNEKQSEAKEPKTSITEIRSLCKLLGEVVKTIGNITSCQNINLIIFSASAKFPTINIEST